MAIIFILSVKFNTSKKHGNMLIVKMHMVRYVDENDVTNVLMWLIETMAKDL